MANFPTWINKNNKSNTMNNSNLSPRQVANRAYSLAIKKLDKDDKRRRPQYTVRERLLLSNTMARAEDLLNKRTSRFNRRVLAVENDEEVIPPPAKKMALMVKKEEIVTPAPLQIKHESPLPTMKNMITPEQMAVSLAVVAVAAYSSLSLADQQALLSSSRDYCRPIMIPNHSTMTALTTII